MFDFIIDYLVKFKPFEQHMHSVRLMDSRRYFFFIIRKCVARFGFGQKVRLTNIEIIETDERKYESIGLPLLFYGYLY